MDYEQKYKEALGWMQSLYDGLHGVTKEDAEHYFPELVEDEKIKNEIIAFLRSKNGYMTPNEDWHFHNRWLAWLEKQGEQLVDKIEPKFKVGDWVVKQDGESFCNGNYAAQITNITHLGEHWFDSGSWLNAKDIRLWTINDAKDGDVLVASDGSIFLFAGVVDCACKYYVALEADNHVKINKEAKGGYWETSRVVYPATKEQRDLLFSKMKQEGYEWKPEEKKLIKMKETKFKVGDWVVSNNNGEIWQIGAKYTNKEQCLYLYNVNDVIMSITLDELNNDYHLWTIQDANDGDVLVDSYSKDSIIILYKGIDKERSILAHCGWNGYNLSIKTNELGYGGLDNTNYLPATKEQRDLLFEKMKGAGYEWDAEKKELRKIDTYQLNENPCSGCTNTKGCITCVNGDQKSTSAPRMLYSDDVIGWLRQHTCTACFDKPDEAISLRINKFKEDFGL